MSSSYLRALMVVVLTLPSLSTDSKEKINTTLSYTSKILHYIVQKTTLYRPKDQQISCILPHLLSATCLMGSADFGYFSYFLFSVQDL
ncbi:MAG: hypothetical protein ACPKPY_12795 [Nitrososphaeraceae archaeon]